MNEATTTLTRAGLDHLYQCHPRHHLVHLVQELALARAFGRQIQPEAQLLHDGDAFGDHEGNSCKRRAGFADFP